jgi:hypothetical protein
LVLGPLPEAVWSLSIEWTANSLREYITAGQSVPVNHFLLGCGCRFVCLSQLSRQFHDLLLPLPLLASSLNIFEKRQSAAAAPGTLS